MGRNQKDIALKILNILIRSERSVSTRELIDIIGCDRKSIYYGIDKLECSGFPIIIEQSTNPSKPNYYSWSKEVVGW